MQQHKLPHGTRIPNVEALNDALADGNKGYAILLAGGLAFSRKTISRLGSKYRVTNHIDESVQWLSKKQILDGNHGNIGEAMRKGAFIVHAYR